MCLITKSGKSDVKSVLVEQKVHGVTKVWLYTSEVCTDLVRVIYCLQIIPIAKLKTNYKSYELKRRLSQSYDVFLTDKRLYHMLPRLLGKKFFEKKKWVLALHEHCIPHCFDTWVLFQYMSLFLMQVPLPRGYAEEGLVE